MVREKNHPLTTAEAKTRLRAAAREFGVGAFVRHRPAGTILIGLAAGFLLAGSAHPARHVRSMVRTIRRLV